MRKQRPDDQFNLALATELLLAHRQARGATQAMLDPEACVAEITQVMDSDDPPPSDAHRAYLLAAIGEKVRVLSIPAFRNAMLITWRMNFPLYPDSLFTLPSFKPVLEREYTALFSHSPEWKGPRTPGMLGRPREQPGFSVIDLELRGYFGVYDFTWLSS